MFKNTFNLNGISYKVVNGLVHTLSKGTLDPCYKGDSSVLDEFCRTHDLALYARPTGQHAYGHQTGQRAKTIERTKKAEKCPECGSSNTEQEPMSPEEYTCLTCKFVFVTEIDETWE